MCFPHFQGLKCICIIYNSRTLNDQDVLLVFKDLFMTVFYIQIPRNVKDYEDLLVFKDLLVIGII